MTGSACAMVRRSVLVVLAGFLVSGCPHLLEDMLLETASAEALATQPSCEPVSDVGETPADFERARTELAHYCELPL